MKSLIKAYEFAWESWKFTWKNLGMGILLVFFPCAVTIICLNNFSINPTHHPILYFGLSDLLFPFWALGWLRYMLLQKTPTLKSYFTIDKTFFLLLVYAFVVGIPLYGYEYIAHLVGFSTLDAVVHLKVGVPMHMGMAILKYYGVGLISVILVASLLSPLYFVFPSLVAQKPFPLLKSWGRVHSFYIQYGVSYTILLIIVCVFAILVLQVLHLLGWWLSTLEYMYNFSFITNWPLWSFFGNGSVVMVLWQYLVSLSLFSLVGLYYKAHLSEGGKGKSRKPKASKGADVF